ncbi:hypothetical protein NQ314_005130 [Rhamnusium bicolor]|uniref:C2H2-type domain-containing protein n=1 Tax=Rhamnusium bicolor TaxID=1586634 RepID=A0AAV8ZHU6_9CUCU|nr:hypothetical protein NQ314_005130 [Rhamnusium bicolor]
MREKDHLCGICDRAFSDKKLLTAHMQVHNGMKPYSCSICNKGFSYYSSLSAHKKIHLKEKNKLDNEETT